MQDYNPADRFISLRTISEPTNKKNQSKLILEIEINKSLPF